MTCDKGTVNAKITEEKSKGASKKGAKGLPLSRSCNGVIV